MRKSRLRLNCSRGTSAFQGAKTALSSQILLNMIKSIIMCCSRHMELSGIDHSTSRLILFH